MKYCITGGLGFIGNEVVRQLKKEHEVSIVDNYSRVAQDVEDLAEVAVYKADITDFKATQEVFHLIKPDVTIHLAAIHYIPECNANPDVTLRVNVEGSLSVLNACKNSGVKHILAASSGAVYADSPDLLKEDFGLAPIDIYGISKKMMEELCHWYSNQHKMPISIFRLFNTYGPRETNAHIIPEIINQLKSGSDILHLGNIKPRRDYIFTTDVATAIIKLSKIIPPTLSTVNLSSGCHASVEELIAIMSELLNRKLVIETDMSRFRKADKQIQVGSIEALVDRIHWKPQVDIQEGLRTLLAYEGML